MENCATMGFDFFMCDHQCFWDEIKMKTKGSMMRPALQTTMNQIKPLKKYWRQR